MFLKLFLQIVTCEGGNFLLRFRVIDQISSIDDIRLSQTVRTTKLMNKDLSQTTQFLFFLYFFPVEHSKINLRFEIARFLSALLPFKPV